MTTNNPNAIQWPIPGIIYSRGTMHTVYVPAPLLCMDLIAWANQRLTSLREQESDPDYTALERRNWSKRAAELEAWLTSQRGTISFETHDMMCLRSEAEPWIVHREELDAYLAKHVLPASLPNTDQPPVFAIWSDENQATIYIAHRTLERIVGQCPSPDVNIELVTPEKLLVVLGKMDVAAHDERVKRMREARKARLN